MTIRPIVEVDAGEVPDDWTITIETSAGANRIIDGATVSGTLRKIGSASTIVRAGSASGSVMTWTWETGDLPTSGRYLLSLSAATVDGKNIVETLEVRVRPAA